MYIWAFLSANVNKNGNLFEKNKQMANGVRHTKNNSYTKNFKKIKALFFTQSNIFYFEKN